MPAQPAKPPLGAAVGIGGAAKAAPVEVSRREDWREYRDGSGKTYYHNVVTKETTWVKPRAFINPSEVAMLEKDAWKEFTTPEGKTYYHNAVSGQTTWTRPASLPPVAAAIPTLDVAADTQDTAARRQRAQAFQEMLEELEIDPDLPWVEALKKIINDPRYRAVKSLGEKKAYFTEYCEKHRRVRKDRTIVERKKAREDFMAMLASCPQLTPSTPWKKAQLLFDKDRRLHAIESERERETLYEDYVILLERRAKEADKGRRKEGMRQFRQLLEETTFIGPSSQWRKVQELLDEDPRFQAVSKMDRLIVFEDYVRELERGEEEARQREKEARQREEQLVRQEFRALLEDHSAKGLLDYTTKWQDFSQLVASDPAFAAILQQGVAQDMFDDWIDELEEAFRREYKRVKHALERIGFRMALGLDFAAFKAALAGAPGLEDIRPHSLRLAYDALYAKEEEKEREKEKLHQKAVDRFFAALNTVPDITVNTLYSEVKPLIEQLPAVQAVESEAERQAIFHEHLQRLRQREGRPGKRAVAPDPPPPRRQRGAEAAVPPDSGREVEDLEARRQQILHQLGLG